MTQYFISSLATAVANAIVVAFAPTQAHASTTVCTPIFNPPGVAPGSPISADLGTTPPCPAATVSVSLNTVGSGLVANQVGTVFATDEITGLGTNNFTRTSGTGVGIGALAETVSGPTTQSYTVSYSHTVVDPYFFFSRTDNFGVFKFYNAFSLLQAYQASLSPGNQVTVNGNSNQDSGFVVQLIGAAKSFQFDYINYSSDDSMSVFTTGPAGLVPPAPGPLPLVGLGVAYSLSRRLRQRISR